jgi:hypothetical protein
VIVNILQLAKDVQQELPQVTVRQLATNDA